MSITNCMNNEKEKFRRILGIGLLLIQIPNTIYLTSKLNEAIIDKYFSYKNMYYQITLSEKEYNNRIDSLGIAYSEEVYPYFKEFEKAKSENINIDETYKEYMNAIYYYKKHRAEKSGISGIR